MLAEVGGLFSLAGLDEGNTFETTGAFFFPDGPSTGGSAGRFTAATPPTGKKHGDDDDDDQDDGKTRHGGRW